MEEIESKFTTIQKQKSPGIDGFPSEFWHDSFFLFHDLLLSLFQEIFATGSVPNSWYQGHIVLVYKSKGDKSQISNYRPLTLLNCDFKLFSKLIGDRLLEIASVLIPLSQKSFLKGRQGIDHVTSIQLQIDLLQSENISDWYITLLDISKAYDTLCRIFTIQIFQVLGFCQIFIKWLLILLAPTERCLRINGWISRSFWCYQGIPQGDPSSPILYIFVTTSLFFLIEDELSRGCIHCISINCITIQILRQFADDILLFTANSNDLSYILNTIFPLFARASLQKLNCSKSQVLCGNKFNKDKYVCEIPVYKVIRYLGIYISLDTTTARDKQYQIILQKIENCITWWSRQALPLNQRILITQIFILSQFQYFLQLHNLTIQQITTIHRKVSHFILTGRILQPYENIHCVPCYNQQSLQYTKGGLQLPNFAFRYNSIILSTFLRYLKFSTILTEQYELISQRFIKYFGENWTIFDIYTKRTQISGWLGYRIKQFRKLPLQFDQVLQFPIQGCFKNNDLLIQQCDGKITMYTKSSFTNEFEFQRECTDIELQHFHSSPHQPICWKSFKTNIISNYQSPIFKFPIYIFTQYLPFFRIYLGNQCVLLYSQRSLYIALTELDQQVFGEDKFIAPKLFDFENIEHRWISNFKNKVPQHIRHVFSNANLQRYLYIPWRMTTHTPIFTWSNLRQLKVIPQLNILAYKACNLALMTGVFSFYTISKGNILCNYCQQPETFSHIVYQCRDKQCYIQNFQTSFLSKYIPVQLPEFWIYGPFTQCFVTSGFILDIGLLIWITWIDSCFKYPQVRQNQSLDQLFQELLQQYTDMLMHSNWKENYFAIKLSFQKDIFALIL